MTIIKILILKLKLFLLKRKIKKIVESYIESRKIFLDYKVFLTLTHVSLELKCHGHLFSFSVRPDDDHSLRVFIFTFIDRTLMLCMELI